MRKPKREKVIVNVLWDEEGNTFWRVESSERSGEAAYACENATGYFLDESDLNSWLESHEDEIQVRRDYRKD